LLPEGILEYFEISGHRLVKDKIHFYLEEKNLSPKDYADELTHSKGFSPEITIEDFSLRGKSVLLHIKSRCWFFIDKGKVVKRDWDLITKGTRITSEFADFEKGILR